MDPEKQAVIQKLDDLGFLEECLKRHQSAKNITRVSVALWAGSWATDEFETNKNIAASGKAGPSKSTNPVPGNSKKLAPKPVQPANTYGGSGSTKTLKEDSQGDKMEVVTKDLTTQLGFPNPRLATASILNEPRKTNKAQGMLNASKNLSTEGKKGFKNASFHPQMLQVETEINCQEKRRRIDTRPVRHGSLMKKAKDGWICRIKNCRFKSAIQHEIDRHINDAHVQELPHDYDMDNNNNGQSYENKKNKQQRKLSENEKSKNIKGEKNAGGRKELFTCEECGQEKRGKDALKDHMTKWHPTPCAMRHFCPYSGCNKFWYLERELKRHIKIHQRKKYTKEK